ncbi:DMT family transporter [Streptomyces sp. HD]|uniref:DMT family transporter n=1 Tax=Streptomyces sp. HD TaxID=3020892 RepID=UPI00232C9136|nr:DMT family transporter [Streptomyces sp. HD]MDC0773765.1 DMT family transporter [Streptomyces sp. HD]
MESTGRRLPSAPVLVGLSAALVATALWGFTFLGPVAVDPVNIYYLVLGRYAVFGLMSAVVLAARPGRLRALGVPGFLKALHLGVVGYIGFYLLLSMAASVGGGVLASTMTGLIPVMVSLISNGIEKVFPWRSGLLPIGVIAGGLFLVNGGTSSLGTAGDGRDQLLGAALGFAACVAWSYFVIANRIILRRAATAPDNSTWTACIGIGACCGSLVLLPLAESAEGTSPFADAGTLGPFLAWCAALAVLGSWCATWFWNIASKRLPATVMGPVIGMEAVFGAFFYLVWEQRMPTPQEFWGALLVIGGVFFSFFVFDRARIDRSTRPTSSGQSRR